MSWWMCLLAVSFLVPWHASATEISMLGERIDLVLLIGNNTHADDTEQQGRFADECVLTAAKHFGAITPNASLEVLATPDPAGVLERFEALGITPQPLNRASLQAAVARLAERAAAAHATARVNLYIVFTGIAEAGGLLQLEDGPLPIEDLIAQTHRIRADHVFGIFDAWFPAPVGPGSSQPAEPPQAIPTAREVSGLPAGFAYIGATTALHQVNNTGGSLFLTVALNGLLGTADVDRDGRVSYFEWRRHVFTQIDADKPFAPKIVAVEPRWDPVPTVLDLRKTVDNHLEIAFDVPNGTMELRESGGGPVLSRWYHHQTEHERLALPAGDYLLIRFSDRAPRQVKGAKGKALYVSTRVYPSEVARVELEPGQTIRVDLQTETRTVYWVPADRELPKETSDDQIEVLPLSAEEEMALIGLFFRKTRIPELERPKPGWLLGAQLFVPGGVTRLGGGSPQGGAATGSGGDTSGGLAGGFQLGRVVPRSLRNRWYQGVSFSVEYVRWPGYAIEARDLDGQTYFHDQIPVHQLMIGPGMDQVWIGPRLRMYFQESIRYGPQLVFSGTSSTGAPEQPVQAVSLTDTVVSVNVGAMTPIGMNLEIGPAVSVQVGFLHQGDPSDAYYRFGFGLQLRPSVLQQQTTRSAMQGRR